MRTSARTWLAAALVVAGAACGGDSSARSAPGADEVPESDPLVQTTQVTPGDTNVVYVDVRSAEEFAARHVAGALNIPESEMARRYPELDSLRDRKIVLYDDNGRLAGVALMILGNQGFDNVVNGGSIDGLKDQGVPVSQ